jgi:hypothetical protein
MREESPIRIPLAGVIALRSPRATPRRGAAAISASTSR